MYIVYLCTLCTCVQQTGSAGGSGGGPVHVERGPEPALPGHGRGPDRRSRQHEAFLSQGERGKVSRAHSFSGHRIITTRGAKHRRLFKNFNLFAFLAIGIAGIAHAHMNYKYKGGGNILVDFSRLFYFIIQTS